MADFSFSANWCFLEVLVTEKESVGHAIPTGWILSNPRHFLFRIKRVPADFYDSSGPRCYSPWMSFIVVDVEADGPIPADYSMVCFGAVIFDDALDKSFYGQTRPISDRFVPEALAVSGFSREMHQTFDDPKVVMEKFEAWLKENSNGRPVFVSDNLAFDWQFINYYFHRFLERNPFGFSGRRIGDLYAGLVKDAYKATEWKKYRRTTHTHNPVDDARGNAEALAKLKELGLKI